MALFAYLAIIAGSTVLFHILKRFLSNSNLPPLPPGPKGWPLIGNVFDLCPDGQHPGEFYRDTLRGYGPMVRLMLFGKPLILVNDRETAAQLFEKSSKHSSRPHSVFADDLCGYKESIPRQENTPKLRLRRRALARVIGTKSTAARFDHQLEEEFRRFMWRIIDNPDGLFDHARATVGSFSVKITYGYNVEPHEKDPLVKTAEEVLSQFGDAIAPGRNLVDLIPALKYLPEWMPGAAFKKRARYYKESMAKLIDVPYEFTKWQMQHEENERSFVSECLKNEEDTDTTKWVAGAIYGAGVDTTVSAIETFLLAMTMYPDTQRKAQGELDNVVGEDRFPDVADRPNLPYINAVIEETLRWHSIAVVATRKADADEVINGYLIPKGTTIVPNLWAMNNDPKIYPNPSEFRPERYIPREGQEVAPNASENAFGFGRRICPGRITAETSIFLAVSHLLFAFNTEKPVDKEGCPIEQVFEPTPEFISHPKSFNCCLTPRSEKRRDLVMDFMREHPFQPSDAAKLAKAVSAAA